ncbi:MAG: hypothetical protein ACPGTU_01485 [Myxococcota bacterium]
MDYIKPAWEIFIKHPLQWVAFGLVMAVANQFFIGFLLQPNAVRVLRTSVQNETPPDIGEYFNFDDINHDALTMLCVTGVYIVGICLCCIGIYAAIPLMVWTAHLASEKTFEPIDNLKASFAHAKSNILPILIQLITLGLIASVAVMLTCGLGAFVIAPLVLLAIDLFYLDNREAIYQAAADAGIQRIA